VHEAAARLAKPSALTRWARVAVHDHRSHPATGRHRRASLQLSCHKLTSLLHQHRASAALAVVS
jgi:hypothetical protein